MLDTNKSSGENYEPVYTKSFQKKTKKLKNSPDLEKAVTKTLEDPYYNSIFLQGNKFKGKRRKRFQDFRMIYVVCEECRKLNHCKVNDCIGDPTCKEKTVKFINFEHRDDSYN